jgi:hypothetical protein
MRLDRKAGAGRNRAGGSRRHEERTVFAGFDHAGHGWLHRIARWETETALAEGCGLGGPGMPGPYATLES